MWIFLKFMVLTSVAALLNFKATNMNAIPCLCSKGLLRDSQELKKKKQTKNQQWKSEHVMEHFLSENLVIPQRDAVTNEEVILLG